MSGNLQNNQPKRSQGLGNSSTNQEISCCNICCFLFLLIIIIVFFVVGFIFIGRANGISSIEEIHRQQQVKTPDIIILQLVVKYKKIIIGMLILSVLLGIIYSLVLSVTIHSTIVRVINLSTLLLLSALIITSGYAHAWVPLAGFLIAFLVFLIMMCCCFRGAQSFRRIIPVLISTRRFIKTKFICLVITLFLIYVLYCIFTIFWIISLVCIQNQFSKINKNHSLGHLFRFLFGYWIFIKIYTCILMYYILAYIMTLLYNKYFYQNTKYTPGRVLSCYQILKDLMSLSILAFLSMFFLKCFQYLGTSAFQTETVEENCCGNYIMFCFQCILNRIKYIVQILNRFTAISIGRTGKSLSRASQIAQILLLIDFSYFHAVYSVGQILKYSGAIFTAGLPTFIGYWIAILVYPQDGAQGYDKTMLILFIFFMCFSLSIFIVSFFTIAFTIEFYFFSICKRLRQVGKTKKKNNEQLQEQQKQTKRQLKSYQTINIKQ